MLVVRERRSLAGISMEAFSDELGVEPVASMDLDKSAALRLLVLVVTASFACRILGTQSACRGCETFFTHYSFSYLVFQTLRSYV